MPNPTRVELEEARAALAQAETTNQELRDFMTDLLLLVGSRTSCIHCGTPVFWVISRGAEAIAFNCDGSQHWPRCKNAERPRAAAAGE